MQQLYSMTGYGKASGSVGNRIVTVEIKALNSRQLDLNLRLSACFRAKEMEVRRLIGESLIRGRIEMSILEDKLAGEQTNSINRELFKRYYLELKSLCNELDLSPAGLVEVIMRIPDVLNTSDMELGDKEWGQLQGIIIRSIELFNSFRLNEGSVLREDLQHRITFIGKHLEEIEKIAPQRLEQLRQKLNREVEDWRSSDVFDQNRFEQELLYYMEKLDINEEIVRLRGHLSYFLIEMSAMGHDKGKKLGFIAQEIGREINTIGSKANYAQMQIWVVQMKDELEKIKEQLMNVI